MMTVRGLASGSLEAARRCCPRCGYEVGPSLDAGAAVCPECAAPISEATAVTPPDGSPAAGGVFGIVGWWLTVVGVGLGLTFLPDGLSWLVLGGAPAGMLLGWLANVSYWLFAASWLLLAWSDNLMRVMRWSELAWSGWALMVLFLPTYVVTLGLVVAARMSIAQL